MSILQTALDYLHCGLSVVPVPPDGSRKPAYTDETGNKVPVLWAEYEKRRPTVAELSEWFHRERDGIAIIGGPVSGGLEIIDIESTEAAANFKQRLLEFGGEQLFNSFTVTKTWKGFHVYYRCEKTERNQDLARRPATAEELKAKPKQKYYKLIETRADGGFVVAPGSPPKCHPETHNYELIQGSFETIPTLNQEERDLVIDVARSLNEYFKDEITEICSETGERTGDLFERQTTWKQILEPAGWRESSPGRWIRPGGKRDSAMVIRDGKYLWCFSSSVTELPFEKATNKFATYTFLNFGGNFSQARKSLAAQGYKPEPVKPEKKSKQKQQPEEQQEEKPKPRIEVISFDDLMVKEFEDLKWFVQDLIPVGLTLLAGAPKIGKSWMALDIAYSVSQGERIFGDYSTDSCEVLYLALEDNQRRLQQRLNMIIDERNRKPNPNLVMATKIPGMSAGGMSALAAYLDERPKCRLVIIDTLVRFIPPTDHKKNAYQADSEVYQILQEFAHARDIGIVGVTHLRKQKSSSDSFDDISGSIGVTGTADSSMVLKRPRTELVGTLEVTGRDSEEIKLTAEFKKDICRWMISDERQGKRNEELVKLLSHFGQNGIFTYEASREPLGGISIAHAKRIVSGLSSAGFVHRAENTGKTYQFCFTEKAVKHLFGGAEHEP